MGDPKPITRQDAVDLILQRTHPLEMITLTLERALDCVARQDVFAPQDIPHVARAIMDGYAICSKETAEATPKNPVWFHVIGKIDPGVTKLAPVGRGQAVRITTGAPLPPGTDAVVKEEDVSCSQETLKVTKSVSSFQHVLKRGKDLQRKSLVIRRGQVITPPLIGALASLEIKEVSVFRRPEVAILAVGSELVSTDARRKKYSIVASNVHMLSAMIKVHGGEVGPTKICGDDRVAIREAIQDGLRGDMLITTGGTLNADSDLTLGLMKELDIDFDFCGVSMLPGKGTAYGLGDKRPVFCLPGTPSAVFVAFYTLVLPALLRLRGISVRQVPPTEAILEQDLDKRPGVEHLVQGLVRKKGNSYYVLPLTGPGVEIFSALSTASGLIVVGPGETRFKKGEVVPVEPLNAFKTAPLGKAFPFQETIAGPGVLGPPMVSIVGKSSAGKTTLLEGLVRALKARGYRVGTVKHDVHGFDINHKGKDSWRHKHAGASTVVISSPGKVSMIRDVDSEETLNGLASAYFHDVDIILTEGYKRQDKPKIEIFRRAVHDQPLCTKDDHLVALVSDIPLDLGVPHFELNDVNGLVDFMEETFLMEASSHVGSGHDSILGSDG